MSQHSPAASRPPVTHWSTDWDLLDPEWVDDPFPIWDKLRSECPIAHTGRYHGIYLPTRYADIRDIAYDTERFSSRVIAVREHGIEGRDRGAAAAVPEFRLDGAVVWSSGTVRAPAAASGIRLRPRVLRARQRFLGCSTHHPPRDRLPLALQARRGGRKTRRHLAHQS